MAGIKSINTLLQGLFHSSDRRIKIRRWRKQRLDSNFRFKRRYVAKCQFDRVPFRPLCFKANALNGANRRVIIHPFYPRDHDYGLFFIGQIVRFRASIDCHQKLLRSREFER